MFLSNVFQINRVYLDPLNMSNAGNFSWKCILKDFIQVQKGKENSSSYVNVLHKTSNQEVWRRSRAVDVKQMYLKAWCTRAELLFWSLNLLFFEVVVVVEDVVA